MTLVCTALSAGLLLAPSAHHRLLWAVLRQGAPLAGSASVRDSRHGTARASHDGGEFVITDVLFGSISASVAAVLIAAFFLYVWFVVPIRYRLNGE